MAKLYDIFKGDSLKVAERIQKLRLQMLIHSYIYYKMDDNIVSDMEWMIWANELQNLQDQNPEIAKQVPWADAFEGWDGSSGAFLPLDDPWVVNKAKRVLAIVRKSQ